MADSQTTSVTTAGPALFTHDGYRLYVFDGVPYMLDLDVGKRVERKRAREIRDLIKENFEDLEFYGLVRSLTAPIPQGGRGKGRTKDGIVYYLNQEQGRWLIIQSHMPAGKTLAARSWRCSRPGKAASSLPAPRLFRPSSQRLNRAHRPPTSAVRATRGTSTACS